MSSRLREVEEMESRINSPSLFHLTLKLTTLQARRQLPNPRLHPTRPNSRVSIRIFGARWYDALLGILRYVTRFVYCGVGGTYRLDVHELLSDFRGCQWLLEL